MKKSFPVLIKNIKSDRYFLGWVRAKNQEEALMIAPKRFPARLYKVC